MPLWACFPWKTLWLFKRLYPKGTQDSARLTAICAPAVLSLTPQWHFKSTPLSPDFDKNLKHCKLRILCVDRFSLQWSEMSLSCISVKLSFLYFNKFGRAFQWKVHFIKNDLNGLNIYWWWQGPCFILAHEDPINLSSSLSRAQLSKSSGLTFWRQLRSEQQSWWWEEMTDIGLGWQGRSLLTTWKWLCLCFWLYYWFCCLCACWELSGGPHVLTQNRRRLLFHGSSFWTVLTHFYKFPYVYY